MKAYRTYEGQVDLLVSRGMAVGDREQAVDTLRRINYYRLSGYWYPFRHQVGDQRGDSFYPGTHLDDVVALHDFDARLRAATFSVLAPIELALRAHLGHELGRVDPCAHLDPMMLGPAARGGDGYATWLESYEREIARSREDFVAHHEAKYGGRLPVWAAVEVLDWGGLTRLYGFAPRAAQDAVADACGLRAPQLRSWMKALNIVRNICAHHGRLFNRVHALTPKLPSPGIHPDLDAVATDWSRTFGQLTLIQFLLDRFDLGRTTLLPAVMRSYPAVRAVPITHTGAPADWGTVSALWTGAP